MEGFLLLYLWEMIFQTTAPISTPKWSLIQILAAAQVANCTDLTRTIMCPTWNRCTSFFVEKIGYRLIRNMVG